MSNQRNLIEITIDMAFDILFIILHINIKYQII
jgi:hypothetical protein